MSLEVEVVLENKEEVEAFLASIPKKLNLALMSGFERIAPRLEKELKTTSGFSDRTGRLRRELFCVAIYNPIGIAFGAYTEYARYVALGHGTWMPTWFYEFIFRASEEVRTVLDRVIDRFCRENSSR